jgi:hypothetical protein
MGFSPPGGSEVRAVKTLRRRLAMSSLTLGQSREDQGDHGDVEEAEQG